MYLSFIKKNEKYEELPESYKTIKYLIHGIYQNEKIKNDKFIMNTNIIYKYLLTYNIQCVKELLLNYPKATKVQYDLGIKTKYNYIQYPIDIMKSRIQSKKNKTNKNSINKVSLQFKKPNARNNYIRNHTQQTQSTTKQIRDKRNKELKK